MKLPDRLFKKLEARKLAKALRKITSNKGGIDFSSNDYLGLANNPAHYMRAHQHLIDVNKLQSGAGGSRLLTGNHSLYERAESIISQFHNCEAALIYPSGYTANLGLIGSIASKDSLVLYDTLCHASIREGMRLSNARAYKFAHNNLEQLEQLIVKYKDGCNSVFVITESVFSMDGDSPDLRGMASLCKKNQCYFIVDEAHAIGVYGEKGQGLVQHLNIQEDVFARVITFGKALGVHGAAVLGSKQLIDYLTNFSRPFIYTTGLAPITIAGVVESYEWIQNSEEYNIELKKLHRNIALLQSITINKGVDGAFIKSDSPIQCCFIPGNSKVKAAAIKLQNLGLDVRPILAPTVPKGEERLRICLHSFNTTQQIEQLLDAISELL